MIPTYYKGSNKTFTIKTLVGEDNPTCDISNLNLVFTFFQYGHDGQEDITINKYLPDCSCSYIDGEADRIYSIQFYDNVDGVRTLTNTKFFKNIIERDATFEDLLKSGFTEYDISKSYMNLSDGVKPLKLEISTTLSEEDTLKFNSHNIISYQVKYLNNTNDSIIISDKYKFYVREALNYDELHPDTPYDVMHKVSDYLYDISFSECDYSYAYSYMNNNFTPEPAQCSAVYSNGLFGKNFDWLYDNSVSFVVNYNGSGNVNSSIGLAGGIKSLSKQIVDSGYSNEAYKIIPFMLDSGINDKGLFVGLNVVPGKDMQIATTGTHPELNTIPICAMMLPKYILDNFDNAYDTVRKIKNQTNVYCPSRSNEVGELHLFVGDLTNQYIVEFINNEAQIIEVTNNRPWMTNYYRWSVTFDTNNHVDYTTATPHSTGVTRSNVIADNYTSNMSLQNMQTLMSNKLKYTKAYTEIGTYLDELCNDYGESSYGDLTITDVYENPEKFDIIKEVAEEAYLNRDRNSALVWQTVHSCVYDIMNRKLYVVAQEDGDVKEFKYK